MTRRILIRCLIVSLAIALITPLFTFVVIAPIGPDQSLSNGSLSCNRSNAAPRDATTRRARKVSVHVHRWLVAFVGVAYLPKGERVVFLDRFRVEPCRMLLECEATL
jgi:hypothetical protein